MWLGGVNASGVAQIGTTGRTTTAARALWEAHRGPIPPGRWVCRICDCKRCVAPAHHELRTPKEHRATVGRVRGNARLERSDVEIIKAQLTEGEKQASIAARHRVAVSTISAIARGVTWTDVPWPGGEP